jgi:large subunit ribosomal protein L21
LATTIPLDQSGKELLPLLAAQRPHYIRAHIHAFPYLLTVGDTLRLPFLLKDVSVGDSLRLNRASLLGSRDYTLKSPAWKKGQKTRPYLGEDLFVCRATVTAVVSEPERVKIKKKRRNRHIRSIKSKHSFTVLTIKEITVLDPSDSASESETEH